MDKNTDKKLIENEEEKLDKKMLLVDNTSLGTEKFTGEELIKFFSSRSDMMLSKNKFTENEFGQLNRELYMDIYPLLKKMPLTKLGDWRCLKTAYSPRLDREFYECHSLIYDNLVNHTSCNVPFSEDERFSLETRGIFPEWNNISYPKIKNDSITDSEHKIKKSWGITENGDVILIEITIVEIQSMYDRGWDNDGYSNGPPEPVIYEEAKEVKITRIKKNESVIEKTEVNAKSIFDTLKKAVDNYKEIVFRDYLYMKKLAFKMDFDYAMIRNRPKE